VRNQSATRGDMSAISSNAPAAGGVQYGRIGGNWWLAYRTMAAGLGGGRRAAWQSRKTLISSLADVGCISVAHIGGETPSKRMAKGHHTFSLLRSASSI